MKRTQLLIVFLILTIAQVFGQEVVNFNGIIKDSQTGLLLEGITVFIVEKNTGTITNVAGEFFFFLPGGIYSVSISANGYKTERKVFDLRDDKFSEIILVPSDDFKKKNDSWHKRKSHFSEQVLIEKQKLKTVKSS
jgi:hypothetical protein